MSSHRLKLLREEVCRVNQLLLRSGLVSAHSGNASGLDRASGRLVIKPSGVDYDSLQPEDLVEVDLATGQPLAGELRPSVDLPHHLYLYRHCPELGGVVHTHSAHATAFAIHEQPIPACATGIADYFGGPIPCTKYVDNQGDNIGRALVAARGPGPAVLLGRHGVFAWGETATKALQAALVVEECARSTWLAMQLGPVQAMPQGEVQKWYDRYQNRYGQFSDAPQANEAAAAPELRLVTAGA